MTAHQNIRYSFSLIAAATALVAISLIFSPAISAAKKKTAPPVESEFKLQFTPLQSPSASANPYKILAQPFALRTRLDKATFIVAFINTGIAAEEFGIGNLHISDEKGNSCEILTMDGAVKVTEEESAALKAEYERRGDLMKRQAKVRKQQSREGMDDYTKGVSHRTMASKMDYGGTGNDEDDLVQDKIEKAMEDSIAIIEEDLRVDLLRIEANYLPDTVLVAPGEEIQGYIEYNFAKRTPKQITIEISAADTDPVSFTYAVSKIPL
jgi:hypothetical protein